MSQSNLNICLFPSEIKWGDVEHNLATLKEKVQEIHPETDLLILPETFATGFPIGLSRDEIIESCNNYQQLILDTIKSIASSRNFAICGSYISLNEGVLANTAFFVEPSGDMYLAPKAHLFSMAGENKIFSPGHNRLKIRYRGWNIAMGICYDVRFPVWCRNVRNDYDLMIFVANWPTVRVKAWDTLLLARAIENLSYVCGVNCGGIDPSGFEYNQSSKIVDYKGEEVGQDAPQGLIYGSLSKSGLERFRDKFPAWKDADPFMLT